MTTLEQLVYDFIQYKYQPDNYIPEIISIQNGELKVKYGAVVITLYIWDVLAFVYENKK